ncbi:hypothetical protein XA68_13724 [Ophiocordyceps unilateralis]|uniref:Uncharacterized protein n=1 Tax=Ophiocordyceps unilateralis TaxID=268505 RepID=A0A2A9PBV0_OPHUN|nr:hypothetical protein XA68_13724 [Ophiocordyceps unilateralis]
MIRPPLPSPHPFPPSSSTGMHARQQQPTACPEHDICAWCGGGQPVWVYVSVCFGSPPVYASSIRAGRSFATKTNPLSIQ